MADFKTFDSLLDETLGALEEKGVEEEKKQKNRHKNKNGNKGKGNKTSSSNPNPYPYPFAPPPNPDDNLNLPDLQLEPEKDDFEIKPEEEITNPVTFEESQKRIGEEVTEEYVEKLMEESAAPSGGHKATVIIHTRTITDDASHNAPGEDFEIKAKEDSSEDAEAELLKQIEEQTAKSGKSETPENYADSSVSLVRKDTGEIFPVNNGTVIGRGTDWDISIEEPDGMYLSEPHATFTIDNKGKVKIKEREGGTTNGTFVNGNKVGSKYLKSGDKLRLGDLDFEICIE